VAGGIAHGRAEGGVVDADVEVVAGMEGEIRNGIVGFLIRKVDLLRGLCKSYACQGEQAERVGHRAELNTGDVPPAVLLPAPLFTKSRLKAVTAY
jgi:hypothetical protein